MVVQVQLPVSVTVDDYHNFSELQLQMRKLIRGIKVKEVGYSFVRDVYIGMVYVGSQTTGDNKEFLKLLVDECKGDSHGSWHSNWDE